MTWNWSFIPYHRTDSNARCKLAARGGTIMTCQLYVLVYIHHVIHTAAKQYYSVNKKSLHNLPWVSSAVNGQSLVMHRVVCTTSTCDGSLQAISWDHQHCLQSSSPEHMCLPNCATSLIIASIYQPQDIEDKDVFGMWLSAKFLKNLTMTLTMSMVYWRLVN